MCTETRDTSEIYLPFVSQTALITGDPSEFEIRMTEGKRESIQCNQAREQNFFISEFEPILTHKIKSIIDKSLKFGTNLLQHKLDLHRI